MADPITAFIAWAGSALGGAAGATLIMYSTQIASAIILASTIAASNYSQRRAEGKARDAWNASLRDRYVMVRSAAEPRQVVLGRQRVSGPIVFVHSYGADRERLVLVIALASHECDAVEAIYVDDEQAQLDGAGNVTGVFRSDTFTMTGATGSFVATAAPLAGSLVATVAYGSTIVTLTASVAGATVTLSGGTAGLTGTVRLRYLPKNSPYASSNANIDQTATLSTNGSGTGSVTLPFTTDAATVRVDYIVSAGGTTEGGTFDAVLASVPFTLVGAVVTVTGSAYPGAGLLVSYRSSASASRLRVRSYTGAPGQAADAALVAALPGTWTSAHSMQGICYLVVECDFDPNAFPAGIPNFSAVVRGAKLYDPRDATTVWSENPALMMRYVALSPLLGRQPLAMVHDTSIAAAATANSATVNYVVNGRTFTRPIYTAGTVLKSGSRAKDALDDLAAAMAGRWCVIDGQLRVRAGTYATPLQTLTDAWLVAEQAVQVQARPPRQDCINVVTGMFSDQDQAWQVVDYPRVSSPEWVTADGAELPLDLPLGAVTFGPQAQQVAAVMLRDGRQGLRLSVTCNLRAYAVEVFDVINVTLSRFGWVNKPFEVLDVSWTLDGGIQLQMKETDPSTYALGTSFAATDPAPNTRLASPWEVPDVDGLAATSGTAQLLRSNDGTIISRVLVTWQPITDRAVTTGGGIEVRWGLASQPESQWQTVRAEQGQTQVHLVGMRDGQVIGIKARAFNVLVRGAWSPLLLHAVLGKQAPPANVASLAWAVEDFGVRLSWPAVPDVDVSEYELRADGASWEAGTLIARVDGTAYLWAVQAAGGRTVRVKAVDTTGNASATAAAATVSVTAPAAPALSHALDGADELLTWTRPAASFIIDRYELRQGASWAGGTQVATTKATSFRQRVGYTGARTYWVAAIDAAGNVGAAGSASVVLQAPGAVTAGRAEVVDNNALLYWGAPATGSLPIDRYEVRKGATWAGGTLVGSNGNSTFTAIFEQSAGSYSYWVAAIDSAGIVGTPSAIAATINQPPDYVLRNDYNDDWAGIYLVGLYLEDGKLYGPAFGQSIQDHFELRGWSTPQDQINAGYPLVYQPSSTTGFCERTMDYGAELPATIITVTPRVVTLSGSASLTVQLSYKALPGDPWIDAPVDARQVLASAFRYVKVRLFFFSTGGDDLVEVQALNIKLSGKLKTDSGTGDALAADSGGTTVAFTVGFIDVQSIGVTPAGTAARYAIYDFADVPNPTSFKVLLFDSAGARVSGPFSWTARGY